MDLFELLKNNTAISPFLRKKGRFVVDDSIGISLLTALSFNRDHHQYLLVASSLYKAQKIYNHLSSFLPKTRILLYPADELIRAESLSESKEMVAQRLFVLDEINKNKVDIVIANVSSVTRFLPSPQLFKCSIETIRIGESYNLEDIKRKLINSGYKRVSKIDQSFQFALRGDILDIFSINNDHPIRIEFFGDEVESIREFDIATQTSIKKIDNVTILPASEILFNEEEKNQISDKLFSILEKDKEIHSPSDFDNLRNIIEEVRDDLMLGNISEKYYKYYSLLTNNHYSFFDYVKGYDLIFVDENSLINSNQLLLDESFSYLLELQESHKTITHLEMYQDLRRLINMNQHIITSNLLMSSDDISFKLKNIPYQISKPADAINVIKTYLNDQYKVVISLPDKSHISLVKTLLENNELEYEILTDNGLPDKPISVTLDNYASGFSLEEEKIVIFTGVELFSEKVRVARFDNRFKEATIIKSFEDLSPGDYIVHEYQGIGQFLELTTLETDNGGHRDYLKIAYHAGELLYVPVEQFQLVRKYLGKDGLTPRLSRLHSKDWENTKKRIKEKVNDLAERLMHLYIERSKVKGFAFAKDDEFSKAFEDSFAYPLTVDQKKAIDDIKKDMESDSPMDRLLCGDVGFGKTEVAFQAAFKAINSGKQVAILCPTTLLARQHYELALERFAPFDINIAVFSRLIPTAIQNRYIKEIAEGKTHLVIGTHRLLSKSIIFKDLGLLIIDEEQRFGVEQKERLKELKNNIDVLTLSATPIPRTLQISLLGVRAISRINSAPVNRMPIQTYVAPFKPDVVKELIERELGRNGQVFYLHNNITTLYMCANRLQKLLPDVTIGVAHGKMDRDDIEDVMMKFYKGDIQVLVCTSIVENGIDVPNANMIIVEDSERYGLAQLYQIKGRVGRSDRIAYAYLFYTEYKEYNEKAIKRLQAIQEFSELGSGYKIAQRDLMIRGAGDILGAEQAGFIDSIGLDMYIKLLNEAVQEKMTGVPTEQVKAKNILTLDSFIPSEYASEADKIELYQEILSAPSAEALTRIKERTNDIFGKMPQEVELLFKKRNIELLKEEADIEKLIDHEKTIEIVMGKSFINIKGIGNILFESIIPYLNFVKLSYVSNVFKLVLTKREDWISDLENILNSLVNIQKTHKMIEVI